MAAAAGGCHPCAKTAGLSVALIRVGVQKTWAQTSASCSEATWLPCSSVKKLPVEQCRGPCQRIDMPVQTGTTPIGLPGGWGWGRGSVGGCPGNRGAIALLTGFVLPGMHWLAKGNELQTKGGYRIKRTAEDCLVTDPVSLHIGKGQAFLDCSLRTRGLWSRF